MAIFKKKKAAIPASPPEEPETPEEIKHVEELSNDTPPISPAEESEMNYREVPVCMSQAQINNLVIENNIMLKQIISEM